jgi:Xaa-Pro dipeptidase
MDRRTFIQTGTVVGLGAGLTACSSATPATTAPPAAQSAPAGGPHPAIAALKSMTADVKPITMEERAARVAKAQQLMQQNKMAAIFLEGGSSMFYFTGVRWGLSERPFVCVIPARGELAWVCPGFEEERARELVSKTAEVRVWQVSCAIAARPLAALALKSGCDSSSMTASARNHRPPTSSRPIRSPRAAA